MTGAFLDATSTKAQSAGATMATTDCFHQPLRRMAERAATAAERERSAAEAAERKAREHADLVRERIAEVRAQLERLVSDEETADAELAHREQRLREAASAAEAATNEAQRARDAVPD